MFFLLGLGLLCGGGYAVFDGWPYLVLERGFTQVIIGSVAVTAGLVLLALSCVLVELRRVRRVVAVAMTGLATGLATRDDRGEPAPDGVASTIAAGEAPSQPPLFGPGALAAVAASAGAAALSTSALSASRPSGADRPGSPDPERPADEIGDVPSAPDAALRDPVSEPDTPDLSSGESTTPDMLAPDPADRWDAALDAALAQHAPPADGSSPDETATDLASAGPGPEIVPAPPAQMETEPAATLVFAAPEPDWTGDDTVDDHVEAAPGAPGTTPTVAAGPALAGRAEDSAPEIWWPRIDAPAREAVEEPLSASPSPDLDDFDRLRDRLTSGPTQTQGSWMEPSPEPALASASSWMTPLETRRPPEDDGAREAEPAPPVWPPQTSPAAAPEWNEPDGSLAMDDAAAPDGEHGEREPAAKAGDATPGREPAPDAEHGREEAGYDAEDRSGRDPYREPEPEPEAEPSPAPAASEEGVVGAYQVGEAHFTIYADGSIQARTPAGDFTFASMEELKTYLASERSRIDA